VSRVLAYTSPAHGHLFPAVSILRQLRDRGHEVSVRTLAGEVERMRAQGFAAAPIDPEVEAITMDDWQARSQMGGLRRGVGVLVARARHDAPDLKRAIEEERPDAVLVDVLSLGAMSAAESWGGPWASVAPLSLPLASVAGPPMGPGLPPARGPLGRARDRALRPLFRLGLDKDARAGLNEVRAGLGLAPLAHAEDLYRRPPLILYGTAEPFEYPRPDWPESILSVGPLAWDPPGELPAELAGVTDPLVLVTTSTEFQDDSRLAATAIEALAGEPLHLVATVPSARAGASLPRAENATVLGFAPHAPILARAVCAVTHGGMGATQKALAHGVPVCVVPFGRDQVEVARRAEVCGAGTRLSARRLSPERLRGKVREAIGRREGAARVAAAFAAAGGSARAAEIFERTFVGARHPGARPS
jgi:MGT family glycosyltransferase